MSDLSLVPIEDMVTEMKRRNISFVIGYVHHTEFHQQDNREIVWGLDGGGVTLLQITLGRMLWGHLQDVERASRSRYPE